jgi:hypothetical protein
MKKIIIHILVIPTVKFFGFKFDVNACYPMYFEKEMADLEIVQLLLCTHFSVSPRIGAQKIIESKLDKGVYEIKLEAIRIPQLSKEIELANLKACGWK